MRNLSRSFLLAAAFSATAFALPTTSTGPSSSQTPYVNVTAPNWSALSVLTAGDSALNGYRMVGVPDGMGAFDNNDGTFTLLVNQELGQTNGIVRAHGSTGAFVSSWVIEKATWRVLSGTDFLSSANNLYLWNATTSAWSAGATTQIGRLCSADLAPASAFYNASTSTGYDGRIFLNGEETGNEGRAFAWVATGADAGKVFELPHLGRYSIENLLANPFLTGADANKTIVAGNDDSTPGQVYVWVGNKSNTGTAIDKAGLTNGTLYGVKVTNGGANYANAAVTRESAGAINGTFTLVAPTFSTSNWGTTPGAAFQTASTTAGVTEFARPEDGAWLNASTFVFNTTGASIIPTGGTVGVTQSARLYKLVFGNTSDFTQGGTISLIVDSANLRGRDGDQARSFDNLTVGNDGLIYVQEDPGNVAYIAKHWVIDPNAANPTASALQILESDRSRFLTGGADFRTLDEETSGIIDISSIINDGTKWFLVALQNHALVAGTDTFGLFEGGQLIAINSKSSAPVLANGVYTLDGATLSSSGVATISNAITLTGTGGVIDTTGTTTLSGSISGTGQLWKVGSGEAILSGVNTYSGNTNVSAGTLTINGTVSSPNVTVFNGGALKGSGRINGNLTSFGTVSPGNSPGILTITGSYTENAVLDIEVGGTVAGVNPAGFDQVNVSGAFTANATSTLRVTRFNNFDPVRGQSFRAIIAGSYVGAFGTLDRNSQTAQVLYQASTGTIFGTGLTETQTFADYGAGVASRVAVGAALWADGVTNGTVIKNGAGTTTSTAKAYLAATDVGTAAAGVLLAADVGAALDSLSPEAYGAVAQMGVRNAHSLARSLLAAMPSGDAWTYQLGYDASKATSTASPTSLNGEFDVNSTYALATRGLGQHSKVSIMLATDHGNVAASGFASKMTGQTVGLGFGTSFGAARLDLGFTSGVEKVSGTRSGQAFSNAKMAGSSVMARLTLAPLAGITPFVGLSRSKGTIDAIAETGTGANLNVAAFSQSLSLAEVGAEFSHKLSDKLALGVTAAYEHDLGNGTGSVSATFADAASPTAFTVSTYGMGKNQFRGGLNLKATLSESSSAGLSYEVRSGNGVKSASELKLNYTCRF
jgi:autotransporter-associated beta strand protein